jgi:hypothetical protein
MQKGDKYGQIDQVDVAVGLEAHMSHRLAPHGRCPVPPWHLPRHRSMGAAPEAFPSIDLSRFAPMDEMELLRIHRPTVIALEASN